MKPEAELWSLQAVVDGLCTPEWKLPREAIRQAQRQRDAIGPAILALLREGIDRINQDREYRGNSAYLAACLLTEFKTPGAFELIVESLTCPRDKPFDLFGDAVHEDFSSILASWIDDADVLDQLIAERSLDEYVRWMLVATMRFLVRDGVLSREEAVSRLQQHLRKSLADGDDSITDVLAYQLGMYGLPAPLPEIRETYARVLLRHNLSELEEIEDDIAAGDATYFEALAKCLPTGVQDTVTFAAKWYSGASPDWKTSLREVVTKPSAASPGDDAASSSISPANGAVLLPPALSIPDELLKLLAPFSRQSGDIAEGAIRKVQEHRGKIDSLLLEALRLGLDRVQNREPVQAFVYHALLFLSEFRVEAAKPLLKDAMLLDDEAFFEVLFGGLLSNDFAQVFATWFDDANELFQLLVDPRIGEDIRVQLMDIVPYLVRDGRLTREEASRRLCGLLHEKVRGATWCFWDEIVRVLADLCVPDSLEDIRDAHQRGLVGEYGLPLNLLERRYEQSDDWFAATQSTLPPTGVTDVVEFLREAAEREEWSEVDDELEPTYYDDVTPLLFRAMMSALTGGPRAASDLEEISQRAFVPPSLTPPDTIRRDFGKVGRNDRCPCGSGKKYKKCCLGRE